MITDILDGPELAAILKVSPRTLEDWRHSRRIPHIRLSAKCVRYRLADVMRALEARTIREVTR